MTELVVARQAPSVSGAGEATGRARGSAVEAFQAIFDAEFSYVCRVLRRLGASEADLEDLAQEVFVSVYAKLDEYDPSRPIRPWLCAFAYRLAANHQRLARHRETPDDELTSRADDTKTPEEAATEREQRALVLSALQALPLDRRTAVVMHDIDGFSAKEIAEAMSVPLNTVYSRIRIGRDEFRRAVTRASGRSTS